jgi:glycosyltransferase involved in cell wall biosynthesis
LITETSPLQYPGDASDRVQVSVIIPALNVEDVIGQCLGSLARSDFPRKSFEVILVDNGSTDRTIHVARSFSDLLNLTLLQKTDVHVSALRNLGASHAHGDILAFLDADCTVSPAWLRHASALLTQEGVGVVGAHYRIPPHYGWVARVWYGEQEHEKQGDLAWVPGGDTWVTRETFERIGGFDESIETNEDCEFCGRVRGCGLRVLGDRTIAVVHLGTPRTLSGFYRKIRWHGTDGLRVFLRNLPTITNARPLLLAFYTLICMAGMGVGVVWALWQKRTDVLMIFLGALLLPPFLLSLRLTWKRKKWRDLLPLTLMHLVYGIARSQPLLEFRNWVGGRSPWRGDV